jgi:hypothetical protein
MPLDDALCPATAGRHLALLCQALLNGGGGRPLRRRRLVRRRQVGLALALRLCQPVESSMSDCMTAEMCLQDTMTVVQMAPTMHRSESAWFLQTCQFDCYSCTSSSAQDATCLNLKGQVTLHLSSACARPSDKSPRALCVAHEATIPYLASFWRAASCAAASASWRFRSSSCAFAAAASASLQRCDRTPVHVLLSHCCP